MLGGSTYYLILTRISIAALFLQRMFAIVLFAFHAEKLFFSILGKLFFSLSTCYPLYIYAHMFVYLYM